MPAVDDELRALIAAVEGKRREPTGSSIHVHQLDGARTEAMVYLESDGARIDWVHGKGTCAITGEGGAILQALRGEADAEALEDDGRLVLYGDRGLLRGLGEVFRP